MRKLTSQTFRYPTGRVAAETPVSIVFRGTSTLAPIFGSKLGTDSLPNPLTTDVLGNIDYYIEVGSYDYLINTIRQPFDVEETGGGGDSDVFVEWIQSTPSASWMVPHAIPRTPQVGVIVDGELVLADVEYGVGYVAVTLGSPMTGKVILT